ncbi:30S ribosomal protein S2 [Spiroplasma turonicum]|uniref:Small ribosomal subunit protein uS2 n=1 Tax=Spiroplasma turonicum TaxID=216946 RepID=A0A0K1P7G9_9MOLU|nr:30S ribosomal protein S2 [Spiroplasma turonicum]AKU80129.1 30S ribosomal protein S2 [Spiroplasma turonicum]ALX71129.1 30S ribosomal protein S2 [Spiroplasma turonicum]
MIKDLTREQLWDAGAQYGHQTKRWNPKMKPYIYNSKNKNHIIDLQKTVRKLEDVKKLISQIAAKKEKIIFVGTKRTAKQAVKESAIRSGNFYINSRWLGGTLTNMKTISLRIKALWDIENEEKTGKINLRPKKEQILIKKEKVKLEKLLGGIKQMHKLPAAMFVVDPKTDEIAVKEARKLRIPVIAICDTNVDPDMVDYVIPANDDIQESVNIITNYIAELYGDFAGIKLAPTTLKFVAQKKEDYKPRENNYNRNNNYEQRNYQQNNNKEAEAAKQPVDSEKSVEVKEEK